jgi:hypothetical protein
MVVIPLHRAAAPVRAPDPAEAHLDPVEELQAQVAAPPQEAVQAVMAAIPRRQEAVPVLALALAPVQAQVRARVLREGRSPALQGLTWQ